MPDFKQLAADLDPEGVAGFTRSFVDNLRGGLAAVTVDAYPWISDLSARSWAGVLCLGMGGSAAGGDFLAALASDAGSAPVIVSRGYAFPSWWRDGWLVLATSHSGNTEETLAAVTDALEAGATVVVICTGGKLADLAASHDRCHRVESVAGQPPRTAFGHLFSRQVALLRLLGILPDGPDDAAMLNRLQAACEGHDFVSHPDVLGERMAQLHAHPIAILGPRDLQPALTRFKNQLNENSGRFARIGAVPEMNHNEVVAWGGVGPDGDPRNGDQALILLTWAGMHARTRARQDWIADHTPAATTWALELAGESLLEALLFGCIVMDWASIGLALLHGKDPVAIAPIDALKKHLASLA